MKIGFVCLHYGSDYLAFSIKSIYDSVDKILVAYSEMPSHGHASTLKNPDSKHACYAAAFAFGDPKNKIQWIEGKWGSEGAHRNIAFEMYPKADLISVVDADEIWHPEQFAAMQEWCLKQPTRQFKTALRTPWRSFNWICDDPMRPDRFFRLNQPMGSISYTPNEIGMFYHFGYARKPEHIKYKLSCHGHKNELKNNWFEEKFMAWSPTNNIGDLHPTCKGFWHAKPFDKNLLPKIMREHPYWNLNIIC